MAIPRDIVDAVRERTDISEVIGKHVQLKTRGNSMIGRCPFHSDRSPSFSVSPAKGLYYCFGCHAGGDVFRFLMEIEGLSFTEAVRELAATAGVEVPDRKLSMEERQALRRRAGLREALDAATAFFETTLWSGAGSGARDYLRERGLKRETIRSARIGYAPDAWTALLDELHRRQIPPEVARAAGLARPRRNGRGHYDTFRNRIVFPIRDERSRVIGFGGRILSGDGPKYLNTPESPLYRKSQVLYGIDAARPAIQRRDRALLVEGYFDVVSLHQAGFGEAVATCGTSLTAAHVEKLRRLTRRVVLLLDADEAGSRAAERSLPLCLQGRLQASRVVVPGAKDPDELVREEGPEALEAALGRAEPLVEWFVERKLAEHGADASGTQRVLDELVPLLARLPDVLVSRVSARLRISEAVVRRRAREGPRARAEAPPAPPSWRPKRSIVHILWLLIHHPEISRPVLEQADRNALFDREGPAAAVIERLVRGESVAALLPDVQDDGVGRTLRAVVARRELYTAAQARTGIYEVLADLALPMWKARLQQLSRELTSAARSEPGRIREVARERAELVRRIKAMRSALASGEVDKAAMLLSLDPAQHEA